MAERGVVAAGHPLTAEAGAGVLRAGGNAVDAALAALMTSFMAEPLLTGLGAGGYMLVAPPGGEPVLLDFMVAAPGEGERAPLDAVVIDFGDAVQVFHIGASSCGVYGVPAGIAAAAARFGSVPLTELAAPAIALARDGVDVNETQALLWELLARSRSPRRSPARAIASAGACRARARCVRDPELADAIERLAADGAAPFYGGDIGRAVSEWVTERGGTLTPRRSRRVRDGPARAGARPLPRPRGAHQPAAERRRAADRVRAGAARARRPGRPGRPRSSPRWRRRRPSARRRSSST